MTSDRHPGIGMPGSTPPDAPPAPLMYRQGDVLLVAVDAIPDGAEAQHAPRAPGPRRGRGHRPCPRDRRARRARVPRRRRALRARPLGRPAHPRGARHDRPAARRLPRRHPARIRAGPDRYAGLATGGRLMVSIGSCDYCGEFCAALGVVPAENFELASGWIPTSRAERHRDLVDRRIECVPDVELVEWPSHVGPWHGRDGSPNLDCPNCFDHTQMDFGEWDATLEHTECPECWKDVAGARVLIERIRPVPEEAGTGQRSRQRNAAAIGNPMASTEPADRARAESAIREYLGGDVINIRWVPSPVAVVEALTKALDETDLDPEPNGSGPRWSLWDLPRDYGDRVTPLFRDIPAEIASDLGGTRRHGGCRPPSSRHRRPSLTWPAMLRDAGQFDPRAASLALTGMPEMVVRRKSTSISTCSSSSPMSAGPVVVLADEIVISERPLVLKLRRCRPPSFRTRSGHRLRRRAGRARLARDPGRTVAHRGARADHHRNDRRDAKRRTATGDGRALWRGAAGPRGQRRARPRRRDGPALAPVESRPTTGTSRSRSSWSRS